MELHAFALDRLHAHPQNSNVMPEALLAKLAAHLGATDRYPPVIVRPLPADLEADPAIGDRPRNDRGGDTQAEAERCAEGATQGGCYQILDGHHRVDALRRIGRPTARCVVWDVDDAEALLLLATLNRLQGQDDPRKRAVLVGKLHEHLDVKTLVASLPEDSDRLRKLMRMNDGLPTPRAPQAIADMPVAVHFFLLPAQRQAVERRLREADVEGSREQALLKLLGVHETSNGD